MLGSKTEQKKKSWQFPDAMVIMLAFILFVGLLTYVVPQGSYERVPHPTQDFETVVPGSFHVIDARPLSVFQILLAIPEGIVAAGELVVLILLLGACFYVIEKTGALREGIVHLTNIFEGREAFALMIVSGAFAAGGALNGMQEEIIALTPVLLYFTSRLGHDAFVAISISYGSAVIGAAFSPMNPFGVAVAQNAAGLPLLSGGTFRLIVLILAFVVWTVAIIRYGNQNRVTKLISDNNESTGISKRSQIILSLTALAFAIMVYGLLQLGWGFNEMSAEFFVLGIVAGLIGKLGINGTSKAYMEGFKEMIFAAMIMGLARSITVILEEGQIIDTIIYALFQPVQYLPTGLAAISMMISQAILHFPVPSYSGQALMTMPVLAPLSDLIGLSRQVCVLTYQYGGILMDTLVPTNGALMAIISIAGISYNRWLKFVVKPTLIIMLLGAIAVLVAILIGYE